MQIIADFDQSRKTANGCLKKAAEILADLKIKSLVLPTDNVKKAEDLRKWLIAVSGTRELKISTEGN